MTLHLSRVIDDDAAQSEEFSHFPLQLFVTRRVTWRSLPTNWLYSKLHQRFEFSFHLFSPPLLPLTYPCVNNNRGSWTCKHRRRKKEENLLRCNGFDSSADTLINYTLVRSVRRARTKTKSDDFELFFHVFHDFHFRVLCWFWYCSRLYVCFEQFTSSILFTSQRAAKRVKGKLLKEKRRDFNSLIIIIKHSQTTRFFFLQDRILCVMFDNQRVSLDISDAAVCARGERSRSLNSSRSFGWVFQAFIASLCRSHSITQKQSVEWKYSKKSNETSRNRFIDLKHFSSSPLTRRYYVWQVLRRSRRVFYFRI